MDLKNWRDDYQGDPDQWIALDPDPFIEFEKWISLAKEKIPHDPNAMILSTCLNNQPSSRVVLLKMVLDRKFIFFTNYESRKGIEIAQNPQGSLLFYWNTLARQIRIEGTLNQTSSESSDRYFAERPRESQINAWASRQSRFIEADELSKSIRFYKNKFDGISIPRPAWWGGYALTPVKIEFWLGGKGRNHQRTLYTHENQEWTIQHLSP